MGNFLLVLGFFGFCYLGWGFVGVIGGGYCIGVCDECGGCCVEIGVWW